MYIWMIIILIGYESTISYNEATNLTSFVTKVPSDACTELRTLVKTFTYTCMLAAV